MTQQDHKKHLITINDLTDDLQHIAKVIGLAPTLKFLKEFSGLQLYIPKYETVIRSARDRAIMKEFDGGNTKQLAVKYGLSGHHIRYIIKRQGA